MSKVVCAALAIAGLSMAGCGVEPRRSLGGTGGDAGQGGTGAAGSGGEAGKGGTGGGDAGSGGSDDPGCVPEERTDEFAPPPRAPVDVLWVIDNSKAMAPFVDRLADNLEGALYALHSGWYDYRLAVTTTGLEGSPDCDGPVQGGEDGRFMPVDGSRPRILERTTPDVAGLMRETVAVGACHERSHPLEAAYRALSAPLVDHEKDPRHDTEWMDGNAGFLRLDASLSVIVVTPHGDITAGSERLPAEYLDLFQGLKGRRQVTLSAITGPMDADLPAGCTAEGGDRLIALTENTGGITLDICSLSADGSEWLPRVMTAPPQRRFYLSSLPTDRNEDGVLDESDFVVSVDGVEHPARTSDDRQAWTYDDVKNAIDFDPLVVPNPAASVIRVSYLTCPPG